MRYFRFVEPGLDGITPVFTTVSENDIINDYFPYWERQMLRVGRQQQISRENCIQDYVTVHWAEEVSR